MNSKYNSIVVFATVRYCTVVLTVQRGVPKIHCSRENREIADMKNPIMKRRVAGLENFLAFSDSEVRSVVVSRVVLGGDSWIHHASFLR